MDLVPVHSLSRDFKSQGSQAQITSSPHVCVGCRGASSFIASDRNSTKMEPAVPAIGPPISLDGGSTVSPCYSLFSLHVKK